MKKLLIPALVLAVSGSASAGTHQHRCHCESQAHKWPRCMQGATVVYGDASISKRYRGIRHDRGHHWFWN
jgi:hypothetical protein